MKMKAVIVMMLGSTIAMSGMANAAENVGTINFVGSITSQTCDFTGEDENWCKGSAIDLGTYTAAVVNAGTARESTF